MPKFRNKRINIGFFLLVHELLRKSVISDLQPVTAIAIMLQIFIFIRSPLLYKGKEICSSNVAIGVEKILYHQEYSRLFLGALEHQDDWHLYYNMSSLLIKGHFLEKAMGSLKFFIVLMVLTPLVSVTIIVLYLMMAIVLLDSQYLKICGIGFSGVLYALKVLAYYKWKAPHQILGVTLFAKDMVWIEIVLNSILSRDPGQLLGHLAGILIGAYYVYGPLEFVINKLCSCTRLLLPQSQRTGRRHLEHQHQPHSGEITTTL